MAQEQGGLFLRRSVRRGRKGHGTVQGARRPCRLLSAAAHCRAPLPSRDQGGFPWPRPPGTLREGWIISDSWHWQWAGTDISSTPSLEYTPIPTSEGNSNQRAGVSEPVRRCGPLRVAAPVDAVWGARPGLALPPLAPPHAAQKSPAVPTLKTRAQRCPPASLIREARPLGSVCAVHSQGSAAEAPGAQQGAGWRRLGQSTEAGAPLGDRLWAHFVWPGCH